MAANTLFYDLAKKILDEVVARFTAAGVALPGRRYISNGEVARDPNAPEDCSAVSVGLLRAFIGAPGIPRIEAINCAPTRTADLQIEITRCVPVPGDQGNPPTAKAIDDSAKQILTDGYVLFAGILAAKGDGSLAPLCDKVAMGDLALIGPEGGIGGVTITIAVQF
ncbi:MAG: hypothetical protein ACR2M4_03190 [Actinomycetota bacterium]